MTPANFVKQRPRERCVWLELPRTVASILSMLPNRNSRLVGHSAGSMIRVFIRTILLCITISEGF